MIHANKQVNKGQLLVRFAIPDHELNLKTKK
jgi:hypothetical protein